MLGLTSMEAAVAWCVVLYRLIVRPLVTDPLRALLTVAAVALGVAVIVAVDLASEASMGSFRSSLESLQGSASYEITQVGGIPEAAYGELARLEAPLAFSPRIESFALVLATGEQVPLFGVDLVGDARFRGAGALRRSDLAGPIGESSAWVSASLGIAPGETLEIVAGDRRLTLDVQGVLDASVAAGSFVVMDIAPAQRGARPHRMARPDLRLHARFRARRRARGGRRARTGTVRASHATGAGRASHATGAGRASHATGAGRASHATGAGRVSHATGPPCSRRSCRPARRSCRPARVRRTAAGCSARSAGTCG